MVTSRFSRKLCEGKVSFQLLSKGSTILELQGEGAGSEVKMAEK